MGSGITFSVVTRLLFGLLLAFGPGGAAFAACQPSLVEIKGPRGTSRFTVELADTDATRSRGLMFRERMAASAGMLFIYDRPNHAAFWMKNTLIPLDMIFADATGVVRHVHANAIPHDETAISGGDGIKAVLEINGGLARRLGIAPGSVMRHPAFAAGPAEWSCDE